MNLTWENQQQLIGDQTSLDYILSCSNRVNNKNDEIHSILTRTTRIANVFIHFELNKNTKVLFFFQRFHLNYMNYISMKKNV